MPKFQLTQQSSNRKTGPVVTSMTTSDSCPDACPLKGQGCYAKYGRVGLHWRKLDANPEALTLEQFAYTLRAIPKGRAFRHNVAGDLPDPTTLDAIAQAARHLKGWTYTHNSAADGMLDAIRRSNTAGFTVNVSTDNAQAADDAAAQGLPTVTLLPEGSPNVTRTPAGRAIVRCPAEHIDAMTCADCMLCQKADRRSIVGFTVHGSGKNKAAKVITIKPATV